MREDVDAAGALTTRRDWDLLWTKRTRVVPPRLSWYPDERFIGLFESLRIRGSMSVLEVGAGASRWLPYLACAWDADVWGLDYSAVGCDLARGALARAGVRGTIVQRGLFDPNRDLVDRFDLVYSLGLIEHFADTVAVVMGIARFARPGGLVLSVVPNMCGVIGVIQRLADRDVYLGHARLTRDALRAAHRSPDLVPVRAGWFGSWDPTVVNEGRSGHLTERIISVWRIATRTPVWAALRLLRMEPESRLLSPYVVCIARREASRA